MSTLSALHRQHLLPGAWAEGYAIATRGGLQRPEGAGLVRVGVGVGQVRLALLFDQHPQTGEQTHRAGDDLVQHRLQRFIGWRRYRDEFRRAVCAAPVHAIQHQAVHGAARHEERPQEQRRAPRAEPRDKCGAPRTQGSTPAVPVKGLTAPAKTGTDDWESF